MVLPLVLWAQTEGISPKDLFQYGVLGLVVLALIVGQLVPGYLWKRERDRADALERTFIESILPASTEMVHAAREILDYLRTRPRE